ncbi:MAG TPA: FAD-dependent oxidoreductase [Euzebyales bacterium]|nr:FAD-dependent oxidoreductase [Euzebyales bacterium]
MTVDDDASVSRAIARDLRRRYGEHHRIVRAESGLDALDALRELVARGEPIAVLLADHRMPGMKGVEFLERAMDIAPTAKRALLTAYADTGAAIAAINTVDLDNYLLKPWDPPEQQLYPVLDELLDAFAATERPAFEGVRVVGHRWSLPSNEVKEFLASNGVPFEWLDVEGEPARRLLEAARATDDDLPVVVAPSGQVLRAPTTRDLAGEIGLSTSAARPFYDLVIVGGGPAGLGAAVYGASEGLRTLLVERSATGGQAGQSSRIENYLGFPGGINGGELARRASSQALRLEAEILNASKVTGISSRGAAHVVALADGSEVSAQACIVATGVAYRRLPAGGADRFTGRGIYYGAATHEAVNCRDEHVYVVGGANSAGQAAVHFSRYASEVTVLVRGDSLHRGMSQYLIDQIGRVDRITVRACTEVASVDGDGHLESLVLRDSLTGEHDAVETSHLFVFIGASPSTDWLGDGVVRDERGFVLTGPDLMRDGRPPAGWTPEREPYYLETSAPGVFAAGDVRHQSVKRVASAVGEGAMAVTLVHRYLEGSS